MPRDINATYYRQRATAGLIVTEGVQSSAIAAPGEMVTAGGLRPHPLPHALETAEVRPPRTCTG